MIDLGPKVHKALSPGLLESAYEHCLAHELHSRGHSIGRQVALPICYDGTIRDAGYRLDIIVENAVIVEIKAVSRPSCSSWLYQSAYTLTHAQSRVPIGRIRSGSAISQFQASVQAAMISS